MAIMKVPVTKGKGWVEVDTDSLPMNVFEEAVLQGLKTLVNRGMTKISTVGLSGQGLEDAKAAAMTKAQENVANLLAGKVKIAGVKASDGKVSGIVMTEAMRIARSMIKDAMKEAGVKVSYVAASEITKSAKALIADNPGIIEKAKASIEERNAVKVNVALPTEDATKKAKAEADKALKNKDKPLSATQAGKIKPKVKGKGQPQANA